MLVFYWLPEANTNVYCQFVLSVILLDHIGSYCFSCAFGVRFWARGIHCSQHSSNRHTHGRHSTLAVDAESSLYHMIIDQTYTSLV